MKLHSKSRPLVLLNNLLFVLDPSQHKHTVRVELIFRCQRYHGLCAQIQVSKKLSNLPPNLIVPETPPAVKAPLLSSAAVFLRISGRENHALLSAQPCWRHIHFIFMHNGQQQAAPSTQEKITKSNQYKCTQQG